MSPLLHPQPLAFICMALFFGISLITLSLLDARGA